VARGAVRLGYCVLAPRLVAQKVVLAPAVTVRVWIPPLPFSGQSGHSEDHTSPEVSAWIYVPDPGGSMVRSDPQGVLSFGLDRLDVRLHSGAPPSITLKLKIADQDWPIVLPSFLATESG
jgi:hypothetical protein